MTLEELPAWIAHRIDRDRGNRHDIDPDAGSEAAEEAMWREGAARRQTELNQLAGYRHGLEFSGPDARSYPSMGTDEVESWRHPEIPDVPL